MLPSLAKDSRATLTKGVFHAFDLHVLVFLDLCCYSLQDRMHVHNES